MDTLVQWDKRDRRLWSCGKISGGIYGQEEEKVDLAAKAIHLYMMANPLHADIFPGIRQIESEIVQMTVDLYQGGSTVVGSITTGGTESILVAMNGYRQWARETKGIKHPEIIMCTTAHAAFVKASEYFNMPLI
jgi:sphinganine-1-phosphate aldolase